MSDHADQPCEYMEVDLDRLERLAKAATHDHERINELAQDLHSLAERGDHETLIPAVAALISLGMYAAALDPATVLHLIARARRAEELETESDLEVQKRCDAAYHTWEQGFKDGQHAASKDRNSIP